MFRVENILFCKMEIAQSPMNIQQDSQVAKMLLILQKWIFLIGFITHLCKISLVNTEDIKTWQQNTNFLNPRNWKDGQLPCENDRIIFPASWPVITMMPESFTASELVFPINGAIIFPENANIKLTGGTQGGSCIGKDVNFKVITDLWYDPINWNITSDAAFPRIPSRQNAAVPHAFQVPCRTDKVVFPTQTTFQAHIIYPVTTVAMLTINRISYSQNEFEDFLSTPIGSLLFPNSPNVRITSKLCTDETGCACGNDAPEVLPTICMQVTPYCPSLECSDPITPVGSCCPICGAQIMIKYKQRFRMDTLLNLHSSFLNKEEFRGVESFTGKTNQGDIQSVFVDGDKYKGLANKVAQLIHDTLNSDITGAHLYQIHSVQMYKSVTWNSGVPIYDQYVSRGMSSGGVAALVIVLIVGLGLAAAFYVYKKQHIPGFNFARFDLRGDKIELELGTTPHDELQPVDSPVPSTSDENKSKGFDNPVYGTTVEEVSPTVAEPSETKNFVENPMFMIFENSQHDDE